MTEFNNILGFCKECYNPITEEERLPEPYEHVFECLNCGHPSLINELVPVSRYE